MGRPREFDTVEALTAAMQVFWLNGYESTSMVDLMAAMDLHKGSIYKAFGDKHQLFIAALTHYMTYGMDHLKQLFEEVESPKEAVGSFMRMALSDCTCGPVAKGCFMMNSVVELAPHDKEVKELIGAFMDSARKNVSMAIERGQALGEFRTDKTADELASYVLYVKAGLLTAGKMQLVSQDPFAAAEMALLTLE
ncbi:MAG: TetR/AcrR family transcriptional regulator [Bacteroidetes bacterium]|nr:MAG: TetR/AcrR family transcriptional regulator [Bacteroidota bacterium]